MGRWDCAATMPAWFLIFWSSENEQRHLALFRGEEEIVGRIRHTYFLVNMCGIAAGSGRFAAFGINALDECYAREHAFSAAADDCDQQPGDGIRIGRRRVSCGFANDAAAIARFPGW